METEVKDIKDIIDEVKAEKGFAKYADGMRLYEQWDDITGGLMPGSSEPSMIKDDILFVVAKNSVVLQELMYRKTLILRNIQGHNGMPHIKDIKFTIRSGPA